MTTPGLPDPHSLPDPHARRPRPLSASERDALSGLETRMNESDPALSARMGRTTSPLAGMSSTVYNRLVQAAIVLVLALVLLPAAWAAVVLMMTLMIGSGLLMLAIGHRETVRRPHGTGGTSGTGGTGPGRPPE